MKRSALALMPWLRGRTQVFLSAIALYACFIGIVSVYRTGSAYSGVQVALTQFLCFGLMTMAGPRRAWPPGSVTVAGPHAGRRSG